MPSELNLTELPVEVLLDIFRNVDQETKPMPIRTTHRQVCRRFNNIISDPNNHRRLSAIRTKVNKITIAKFGPAFAIRVFRGKFEDRASETNKELIYSFPEIPLLANKRNKKLVHWRWIGAKFEFFSFSLRFVTSELIEEWTSGPDEEDFDFFPPIEDSDELSPISLRNFSHIFVFISTRLFTTLAELINAIEIRIKIRAFDWQISLADEEREIRNFMEKNNLKYQIVDRFSQYDTREGLKIMKFHKFRGVDYVVLINFSWNPEAKCYHAMCANNVYRIMAE